MGDAFDFFFPFSLGGLIAGFVSAAIAGGVSEIQADRDWERRLVSGGHAEYYFDEYKERQFRLLEVE